MLPLIIEYVSITTPVYGALVERHDVLGEGARLVREDVLYLAEFFVQCGRSRFCWRVVGQIVHLPVPVDQLGEEQANHLDKIIYDQKKIDCENRGR